MRRRPGQDRESARTGFFAEFESTLRHLRRLPLLTPVILLIGVGAGRLATGLLGNPADAEFTRAGLLASASQLEALAGKMHEMKGAGTETADYVTVYQEHVEPVERVLRRRGVKQDLARNVAWPLVEHAYLNKLDVATVLSVVFIESNARPNATSSVGARGLMQVMPWWSGRWRGCGSDLYEIEDNLCNGTRILAYYMSRNGGNERRAFLGYNGCVTGSVTPNCHTYPDKLQSLRRQIAAELASLRPAAAFGRSAAP